MDAQHQALLESLAIAQESLDAITTQLGFVPKRPRGLGFSSELIQVRNIYVFNAATTGAVAATPTHVIFTTTGRVFVDLITAFCFQTLASAGTPAITLGTLNDVDAFIAAPTGGAPGLVAGDWWTSPASSAGSVGPTTVVTGEATTSQRFKLLSESIGLAIPVSTVTGGVLIFDCWYKPITDDGKLVATVN